MDKVERKIRRQVVEALWQDLRQRGGFKDIIADMPTSAQAKMRTRMSKLIKQYYCEVAQGQETNAEITEPV